MARADQRFVDEEKMNHEVGTANKSGRGRRGSTAIRGKICVGVQSVGIVFLCFSRTFAQVNHTAPIDPMKAFVKGSVSLGGSEGCVNVGSVLKIPYLATDLLSMITICK